MNSLKLTLLLSLAPCIASASAGNCCDRTEVIQNEECNTCTSEFMVFKAEDACCATRAYVSVLNEIMSIENWAFVCDLTKSVFGDVTEQTDDSITFIFERSAISDEAWFTLLAEIEAKFVVLKEVIETNPSITGGVLKIGLNK